MHRSAVRRGAVPLALLGATILWGTALVAAPYALTHDTTSRGLQRLAIAAYAVGRLVCHQQPERSFVAWAVPLPVCARCAGLYAAAPVGLLWGLVVTGRQVRRRPEDPLVAARRWLIVASVPTAASVVLEFGAGVSVSGWVRCVAALPLSAVVGRVVVAGLRGDLRDPDRATAT